MLVRTEAIALRSVDYGETSQIVTLFTRSHGRMTVMARGSRGARSRFGSTMQPLSYSQVVVYHRPGRSIHSLSESSHVRLWRNLTRDIDKLGIGLRMIELVNALFLDDDPHEHWFDLLATTLARLDDEHERPQNLWPWLQLRLATELGFEPAFAKSDIESVRETCYLSVSDGRVSETPGGNAVRASRAVIRAFAIFARSDIVTATRLRLDASDAGRVNELVESYVRYHIERAYPTKVADVIRSL